MAVRFIIGRAGTGKTHHCLSAIRERLRHDPIDGPRLIFLVPEQAGLQMERTLLQPPGAAGSTGDIPGAHRAEVLSFQRLSHRVQEFASGPTRQALTEPARAMVLRHIVTREADRLKYYRGAARRGGSVGRLGGLIDRLSATVAELIQEAIEPEALARAVEDAGADDPAGQAKLHDLRRIYEAYLSYLGEDKLDPSQHLEAARACFDHCPWLRGAELWVDGFASFSGQEARTLSALATLCGQVDITVMMDDAAEGSGDLFSRIRQTLADLQARFLRAGIEVAPPVWLRDETPPRFRKSTALARLERSFGRVHVAASPGERPEGVELVELPSRRTEVDYAVSRICRWVREGGGRIRYRDMAIIARDLEPYHDLIAAALTARDIPFFVDRRRPVAHHPLVELLRSAVAMSVDGMSLDSVRPALKTGLLPLTCEAGDELENYLLAHGIHGIESWCGKDWSMTPRALGGRGDGAPPAHEIESVARVNAARQALLRPLKPWLTFASSDKAFDGPTWVRAITELIGRLDASATMQQWVDDAEVDGHIDLAEEHRQVWRDVTSFLDDLAFAFSDSSLTALDLADVLEAGLSGLTLGLVPPMVDQVLVGSIERSRHPDLKAAVILGFNDGVFPRPLGEDSILNDDDRAVLNATGVSVRAPARARLFDETLLAYVALTRAGEHLVVTYASADDGGRPLRPSPFVSTFREACPGLEVATVADPRRSRNMWDILTASDLSGALAMEFAVRPPVAKEDQPGVRARWNELYDSVRAGLAADRVSRRALAALDERRDVRITPHVVERMYEGRLRTSVSELETYAACPFQHFARYTLRLRERAEVRLEPLDVGLVHHAILEDFVATIAGGARGLGEFSDTELMEGLQASCSRVAARMPEGGAMAEARNAYLLRRSASSLARVIRAQRRRSQAGKSRPHAVEVAFGFGEDGGLPAIELSTPSGRRVLLRGYIDRVDLVELGDQLLGIVIDYKRTRDKRLDLTEVYHGLSLQLPAYLLALAASGKTLAGRPIRPAGALYVSLAGQYHAVDHPDDVSQRDLALLGTFRPHGLLHAECVSLLDQGSEGGWLDHYSVYRKKDGELGHIDRSDAADDASFRSVLEHTRAKLGELADGILDGNAAVHPYRLGTLSPCSWCAMPAVCRFEMGASDVRYLESLKRSEVFKKLAERT